VNSAHGEKREEKKNLSAGQLRESPGKMGDSATVGVDSLSEGKGERKNVSNP